LGVFGVVVRRGNGFLFIRQYRFIVNDHDQPL